MEFNVFQNKIPLIKVEKLSSWKLYKFDDVLIDDTKNGKKIKKEEFLEQGEYPIVDQGQSYIAGYTNEKTGIYETDGALIFGDHTRIIKYVDFPLYLGADGVKLLKSRLDKTKINMKYIYYFMKTIDLPSDGYSRHFKYLKEVVIPIPSMKIQENIINTLDKAQELIDKRKEQIEACDELVKSRFIEMFGDPVKNPMEWQIRKLENISSVGSSKRVFVDELVEYGIPFYRGTEIGALSTGENIIPTLFITLEHYNNLKESTGVPSIGDLLMPSICPDGRIWRVDTVNPFYFKDGRVLWVHLEDFNINSVYLQYMLREKFIRDYNSIASGTTFAELKIFALKNVDIMIPPIALQNQFASFVQQVDKLKFEMEQSLKQLEDNFNALMQRAFKGELFN